MGLLPFLTEAYPRCAYEYNRVEIYWDGDKHHDLGIYMLKREISMFRAASNSDKLREPFIRIDVFPRKFVSVLLGSYMFPAGCS